MKKILSLILVTLFVISPLSVLAESEKTLESSGVFDIISEGIASAENYISSELNVLHSGSGVTYGVEWYIISMLRAGKLIDEEILNEYYQSVEETVINWTYNTNPTDIERTVLALLLMNKDITDINGVNLADLIYNNPKLADSSTDMGYALLALDAVKTEIPQDAMWNRESMVEKLLTYQAEDGSFGLNDNSAGDTDLTAMCIQMLYPYKNTPAVNDAITGALTYLKNSITESLNYSDNSNTTAQVLLALSVLDIDITDENNGFCDGDTNIITSLYEFENPDGNGYTYENMVNGMATVQVMQSFDAYRKIHMDEVSYWDFTSAGNIYDDSEEDNDDNEENVETEPASPAVVYVTIASEGRVVTDKNGKFVARVPVTVTDNDEDGVLTVDEALYASHELLYPGGAGAGYLSYNSTYGLSLATLWGNGTLDMPASAGYWLNNATCWSLADVLNEGDCLTAFNYNDSNFWSDAYSYFETDELTVKKGRTCTAKLMYQSGYGENYTPVFSECPGAKIIVLGSSDSRFENLCTNSSGLVNVSFPDDISTGDYYIIAYKEDGSIVPSECKITVTSASGGRVEVSTDNITVYIKVSDPEGETFLKRTKYTVEEGTTVYELLEMTGLDIVSKKSLYGTYISSIEGLAEFDEGAESGWMFKVNKTFPSKSISSYILSTGDYVEVLYTRDAGNDIGNGYSDSSSSDEKNKDEIKEDKTDKKIFSESTYTDIFNDDWYYDAVKYTFENNLMNGTGEKFEPELNMTRAMFVTVLWRIAEEPAAEYTDKFNDIKSGEWFTDAVLWAADNKIASGTDETYFDSYGNITREQLITMLYRYAEITGYEIKKSEKVQEFSDCSEISEYAVNAFSWAVNVGIVNGTNENKLLPKENASRAEVAVIMMRFCNMMKR